MSNDMEKVMNEALKAEWYGKIIIAKKLTNNISANNRN